MEGPGAGRPNWLWAGFAAWVWALMFATMSFYWAAGGTIGIETQAESIQAAARDPDAAFVVVLWATGALKAAGAVLALALVQRWGRMIPRRLLLAAGWAAGIGMLLYGGLNFAVAVVVTLLRAAGVIDTPPDPSTFWWHLLLWDPWWMLGGALFTVAVLAYQRRTRA